MNIGVVIPTCNRAGSLPYTLEALGAQTIPENLDWEVIVVDNNSSDATRVVVHGTRVAVPAPVHYVFAPRQGVSHTRNAGIDHAKGDPVAFTDDDMLPAPDWVAAVHHAVPRWAASLLPAPLLPDRGRRRPEGPTDVRARVSWRPALLLPVDRRRAGPVDDGRPLQTPERLRPSVSLPQDPGLTLDPLESVCLMASQGALMSGGQLQLETVAVDRNSNNETQQAEANLRGRIDA